jgi:hypothetical protein
MRQAHLRDAVALVNYFVWLEDALLVRKAVVSEAEGAAKLLSFRQQVLRSPPSCPPCSFASSSPARASDGLPLEARNSQPLPHDSSDG